jgi:membrane peptidoglycan carboxypeptidase
VPAAKDGPRVMSTATASSVLQALRGPVKRGTARAANSPHALVYGKTGTSSRNEDALFVGLTEGFVGSIWLGYDRPSPMPGIHGGGTPAKAFAKLTDFYYLRLAQARFAGRDEEPGGAAWGRLKTFAARQPGIIAMTTLGSLVMLCFLLPALFRRRELPASAPSLEPPDDDRDLPHQPYQQPPQQSA